MKAIGKRIGRPAPYIIVTKMFVLSLAYLKSILKAGPVYKFIYYYSEVHLVNLVFLSLEQREIKLNGPIR